MTYITMTTQVATIRVYDRPDGYDRRLPYLGLMTATYLNDTTVYLHGAVMQRAIRRIDRETRRKVLAMLREQGVTTVMFERRGHMKTKELPATAD